MWKTDGSASVSGQEAIGGGFWCLAEGLKLPALSLHPPPPQCWRASLCPSGDLQGGAEPLVLSLAGLLVWKPQMFTGALLPVKWLQGRSQPGRLSRAFLWPLWQGHPPPPWTAILLSLPEMGGGEVGVREPGLPLTAVAWLLIPCRSCQMLAIPWQPTRSKTRPVDIPKGRWSCVEHPVCRNVGCHPRHSFPRGCGHFLGLGLRAEHCFFWGELCLWGPSHAS